MIEKNRKLTVALQGKAVETSAVGPEGLSLSFSDGSRMTVSPAPQPDASAAPVGFRVDSVFQSASSIELRRLDGAVVAIPYALGATSVQVRNPQGQIVYIE